MRGIIFIFVMLSSFSSFGQELEYALKYGGTNSENGYNIVLDELKNSYTVGTFSGTVDFDPGPGTHSVTAIWSDFFISKLDSIGNFVWVRTFGSNAGLSNSILSIDVNSQGKLIVTGGFAGTIDFDPSSNVYNLSSSGSWDIYILSLDINGLFDFAKRIGGTGSDFGRSVKFGINNDIYIAGQFSNTVDFDPNSGVQNKSASGNSDAFIGKYNSTCSFIWINTFGGSVSTGNTDNAWQLDLDSNDNILIGGSFAGTCDFDSGSNVFNLTSNGLRDIFVLKLNSDGIFQWAISTGGAIDDLCYSVKFGNNSEVLAGGLFQQMSDFDPGTGTTLKTAIGGQDGFYWKLDVNGNFLGVLVFGGSGEEQVWTINQYFDGSYLIGGHFSSTVDFDPSSAQLLLTSTGNTDIFQARFDPNLNFLNVFSFGGISQDVVRAATLNIDEELIMCGYFQNTVDFNFGIGILNLTSTGGYDVFISKILPCSSVISNSNSYPGAITCALKGSKIVSFDNSLNAIELSDTLKILSNQELSFYGNNQLTDSIKINSNSGILIEPGSTLTLKNLNIKDFTNSNQPLIVNSGILNVDNTKIITNLNSINPILNNINSLLKFYGSCFIQLE